MKLLCFLVIGLFIELSVSISTDRKDTQNSVDYLIRSGLASKYRERRNDLSKQPTGFLQNRDNDRYYGYETIIHELPYRPKRDTKEERQKKEEARRRMKMEKDVTLEIPKNNKIARKEFKECKAVRPKINCTLSITETPNDESSSEEESIEKEEKSV